MQRDLQRRHRARGEHDVVEGELQPVALTKRVGGGPPGEGLAAERRVLEVERAFLVERLAQHRSRRLADGLVGIGVGEVGEPTAEPGRPPPDRLEALERFEQVRELGCDHPVARSSAPASCLPLAVRGSASWASIRAGCM